MVRAAAEGRLIFHKAPFVSCHASTIVEGEGGRLLAAWFGGKDEGAKDVQIWGSIFDGQRWSEPQVWGSEPGQPCWNPVLFRTLKGTLYLWYKAGPNPQQWTGFVRTSRDGGQSWTPPQMLPAGQFGPVRAKPLQRADGTLLAGTSIESYRNWTPYVDFSDDDGQTWRRSNPFPLPGKHHQIQPTLYETAAGNVVALLRSRDPRKICRAESRDGGRTFTPATETDLPNPNAGIDVVRLKNGDLILIYNPTTTARTPLSLARSSDDGKTWKKIVDLETEPGEYSYPAMIVSAAGLLEITYTWRRTHIKHLRIDPHSLR
ncbi:MAG: exo-alpha-sialidase [Gemmataceae bacterium]|nr:exo-alpha-sialidase [Gemmataceae bacterium]MCS7269873.1 exo-alpha-sialidase [Gemmataceae bacterium]MDW8243905.1 sialidase family protein [Thermogemmata sp.]